MEKLKSLLTHMFTIFSHLKTFYVPYTFLLLFQQNFKEELRS